MDDYRVVFGGTPNLPERPYGEPGAATDEPASDDAAGLAVFQVSARHNARAINGDLHISQHSILEKILCMRICLGSFYCIHTPAHFGAWPVSSSNGQTQAIVGLRGWWRLQVTLRAPADILGSVSLRGEEDGWFSRAASSALAAVLTAGGWPAPLPDEFFFQVPWPPECSGCLPGSRLDLRTSRPRRNEIKD